MAPKAKKERKPRETKAAKAARLLAEENAKKVAEAASLAASKKVGKSKFAGSIIVRLVAGNPRKVGTFGNRNFEDYAAEVGSGVTYASWRASAASKAEKERTYGGLNHLNYDIAKGFVAVVPASEFAGKIER